jgi:hypothetical protein
MTLKIIDRSPDRPATVREREECEECEGWHPSRVAPINLLTSRVNRYLWSPAWPAVLLLLVDAAITADVQLPPRVRKTTSSPS